MLDFRDKDRLVGAEVVSLNEPSATTWRRRGENCEKKNMREVGELKAGRKSNI